MAKNNKDQPERGIEATLAALDLDTDADTETVAQEAADAVRDGGSDEPPVLPIRRTLVALPDPAPPAAAAPATSTVVTQVDATLPGAEGDLEFEDPDSARDADGNPMPRMDERVLVPPPKIGKPQVRKPPGGAARLGKGLAEKMPGAEKIKVYKRVEGQRWFIKSFTKNDFATYPDAESFLVQYVKPKHGAGEYDLVGVTADNREVELGQQRLIEEPTNKPESSMMEFFSTMTAQNKERDDAYLARMEKLMTPSATPDPLALLSGVFDLQEKINAKTAPVQQAAAAEAASGMQGMMQMFMASMQHQNQMMIALITKPREESPFEKMFMMKMMKEMEGGGSGGTQGLPPPLPPPATNWVEAATAVATILGALGIGQGNSAPPDDDFKEFLKALMLKQQSEQLTTKDVIALLTARKEEGGSDSFKSAIDQTAALLNFARNVNQSEGQSSSSIFDVLAAAVSNRDLMGGIANTIRAKTDTSTASQEQRLAAERQRLQMERRLLQKQQAQLAEQNGASAPAQQSVQQPQPQPQPRAPQPVAVVEQPAVTPEQAQRAAEKMIERTGKIPQLPALTHEHINGMLQATDEADLAKRFMQMIVHFAEFEDWRGFAEGWLGLIREGNRGGTLHNLKQFLEGLIVIQMIENKLANAIMHVIDKHFDAIQKQLVELPLESDNEITAESLMDGVVDAAAAIP